MQQIQKTLIISAKEHLPLSNFLQKFDDNYKFEHETFFYYCVNKHTICSLRILSIRWSWKRDDFAYSPKRSSEQPGYIGSYCMDGLAMALHCVWTTQVRGNGNLLFFNCTLTHSHKHTHSHSPTFTHSHTHKFILHRTSKAQCSRL